MAAFLRIFYAAFRALRRNVMRSALTSLGIIVGIAAVIAMVEIGQGSADALARRIASMGANVVQIDPAAGHVLGVNAGAGTTRTLIPQDCAAILAQCPEVRWAAPGVDCRMQVIYGHRNWAPWNILGTAPAYLEVRHWTNLAAGAMFTDDDVRRAACVCLIGQTTAHALFDNQSPIGKLVRVNGVRLKVVGELQAIGPNMMGRDQDDLLIVPWTTVKYRISGGRLAFAGQSSTVSTAVNTLDALYPETQLRLYPPVSSVQTADRPLIHRAPDIDDIYVAVDSTQDIPAAITDMRSLLRARHRVPPGQPDDIRIRNWTEITQALGSTTRLMGRLLLSVALISLVVGGVGIMNIMLVSVTERTREIGLRMAVGARARDILRQFLLEALLLTSAGGLVGLAVGRLAAIGVTHFLHWPTVASPLAMLAAVGVSAGVGIIFGFYPAWKASRLDPIEALRFE